MKKEIFNDKYHNLDYIKETLQGSNEEEFEKIKKVQGWSDEQASLYSRFAKLRKKVIDRGKEELKDREKNGESPSKEELSMGAFKEDIETQVRDAVISLRRRGYNTFESGFYDFNAQVISFNDNIFDDEKNLESFKKRATDSGLYDFLFENKIKLDISPNSIYLEFNEYKDTRFIKNLWKKINNCLPDLGEPAKESFLPQAKNFREKYLDKKNIKN